MAVAPFAAGPGFEFADPIALGALFVGLAVFAAVGALSHQRERAFSASLIYLALGAGGAAVIAVLDVRWLDPVGDAELLEHVCELAVIVACFSAGLKLDRPLRPREWGSVARLLGLAMPLAIAAVAAAGAWVMGLPAGVALLLGACLAPTDPVLAGDIGVGPPGDEDEHEPNFALTAEAGLNDGLAFPFVFAALFMIMEDGAGWLPEWVLADVVYGIVAGLSIGAAVGAIAAWGVKRLRDADLLAPELDGFHGLAAVLVTYGLCEVAGAYGFVGAFAGGVAFRRYEVDHEVNATVHRGAEVTEKLLELTVILLLGSMLTLEGLAAPGWQGWLVALLVIVIARPVSVLVALVGSRLERPGEKAFVAWFGVRGVGSLYYTAFAIGAGAVVGEAAQAFVWTVVACVLLSIVVHGVTAGPSLRRLMEARRERRRRRRAVAARG